MSCVGVEYASRVHSRAPVSGGPQVLLLLQTLLLLIQKNLLGLQLLQLLRCQIQEALLHKLPQLLPPLHQQLCLRTLGNLLLAKLLWLRLLTQELLVLELLDHLSLFELCEVQHAVAGTEGLLSGGRGTGTRAETRRSCQLAATVAVAAQPVGLAPLETRYALAELILEPGSGRLASRQVEHARALELRV